MAYRNNMNPMKLMLVVIFMAVIVSITLTGCKKCVSTEYEYVPVKIIDAKRRSAYSYPVRVGKTTSIRVVPASYNTVVEYDSVEYSLSSSETYYKYRDKIGKTAKGKLETKRYDDGSTKVRIVSLE